MNLRCLSLVAAATLIAGLLPSCTSGKNLPPLATAGPVDLQRYSGLWFEQFRLPNSFQNDEATAEARYTPQPDGSVRVVNTEVRPDGTRKTATGTATAVPGSRNSRLRVKFDGLAAGKGVAVCPDRAEAEAFIDDVLEKRLFGAGDLLIEQCLSGPEISIFVSVCDDQYQILMPARDYKRIGDNDQGPNTGGMGAVASRQLATPELMAQIENEMVKVTVKGLQKDGLKYRGFLYFGIMLTPTGPQMLEFNCRFGDPEAEAVMPMVRGDFANYVFDAAKGTLKPELIQFAERWSICLISASAGYPVTSRNGDVISGLEAVEGARVYHCGTRKNAAGQFETNGGRVLAVVAQGTTREEARDKAYAESRKVTFDGLQRRTDIATVHFD
ncbi:MAG TPA: hypothetical protein DCP71_12055 [Verrucomicrobiales bacterium]|nr:hypothetical protein [Verrucomicrobiales bacterium]